MNNSPSTASESRVKPSSDGGSETADAENGPPDDALVVRCQAGDTGAFDELVTRYRGRVYAMIYNMVKSEADAWDLSQEAFIKALIHASTWHCIFHSIRRRTPLLRRQRSVSLSDGNRPQELLPLKVWRKRPPSRYTPNSKHKRPHCAAAAANQAAHRSAAKVRASAAVSQRHHERRADRRIMCGAVPDIILI